MKNGWVDKRLDDLVESNVIGLTKSSREQGKDRAWPYVKMNNITRDNRFDFSNFTSVDATDEEVRKLALKDGDFLFNTRNSVELVGKSCLYESVSDDIVLFNNNIMRIRFKDGIESKFVLYAFSSKEVAEKLNELKSGTTNVAAIYYKDLRELIIPTPPLPEQQRIVGILDEAFEGIATATANAEKNLHNARALFESHLQSVFTQRGKGWGEKRLDQVCTFSSGGTPSKSKRSYWSGKIPWVSGRDMKSTQLSDSLLHISRSAVDESSTRMAPAGALLILVRGMGLVHGAQIAELMVPCAFNQDIRAIHPEPDLIPRYLLFALRDRINSSDNVLSSAAHGTLKIDSDELKRVMIPVPSRGHQQRVVATIDSLSEETQRLESIYQQKLAALDELKKSLLHQAFSGAL
ncbi:restriction endonuclease subunit S [Nitrospira sp. NS4]|uniref:restriction endonuclease subunit S n=1 Tax=Nitrospira sp. NS4 TaxID=3414498 RepID=UPI003C304285